MAVIDLVYNPAAGSFREATLAQLVCALKGEGFEVSKVPTRIDGVELSGKADIVCVHGGDGTLRDVVRAMGADAGRVPICIARSGTINLVARELGYAAKPEAFAAQIAAAWKRGPERWVRSPLFMLGEMPIVSCLSIGPDSAAVARVSGPLKKRIGRLAYAVAMLSLLRDWPRNPMLVKGELPDGTLFEDEVEAVIASHAALYAGPFQLSPRAGLASEAIEIITLQRASRAGMLAFVIAAMLRLPVDRFAFATIRSARRVTFDRCVSPVQVDGDHMPECAYAIAPSGMALTYLA